MDDIALLVDQELLKVPLQASWSALRGEGVWAGKKKTHLDTGEAENAGLLSLEVLVDVVGVVAVDVGLLHEGERYAVVELAEARNLLVRARLLAAELCSPLSISVS